MADSMCRKKKKDRKKVMKKPAEYVCKNCDFTAHKKKNLCKPKKLKIA
jgi:hypothetical protein